tara:strand:+ start:2503 stop:3486 length:984 start_codon:yes stop_codon:yes gene_type:complete
MQRMKNYKWFAGSLVFPISGFSFFIIPVLILKYWFRSPIIQTGLESQKKFFIIGSLDSINSIIGSYATPYISVLLMTILDKTSLPMTMIASFFYLKRRYFVNHYLGAFLTLYGVLISFIPEMLLNIPIKQTYWIIIYICNLFPAIASYCFKEKYLKQTNINLWWMNACISIWQILFGLITLPVIYAPLPSGDSVEFQNTFLYFYRAYKCQFMGLNSLPSDNCQGAFWIFFFYQLISTFCNILMFYIIKKESSVVYIIINTLKMPITCWLGSYSYLVGSQSKSVNVATLFSFVAISVGTIVYNWKNELSFKNLNTPANSTPLLPTLEN